MLDDIRNRVTRMFGARAAPTAEQERSSRQRRADTVARLQQEIRQLQQDISDLSDETAGSETDATSRQMASLHRDLKEKQGELGRYQARI
jgi:uncharacterized protein YlxW (UPF0749 family)